jgi:DNA-binding beta-propeller fold protein YncE
MTFGDPIRSFSTPTPDGRHIVLDDILTGGASFWYSDSILETISLVSLENGAVQKTLAAPAANPRGLAVDGNFLYVVCQDDNRIDVIDPQNGIVQRSFATPGTRGSGLTFDGRTLMRLINFSIKWILSTGLLYSLFYLLQ